MKKALMIAAVLATSWLNTQNAKCIMQPVQIQAANAIANPITNWNIIANPFSTHAEHNIYTAQTWNQNLPLAVNQNNLLNAVIETCFDFTFEVDPQVDNKLIKGHAADKHLMFSKNPQNINAPDAIRYIYPDGQIYSSTQQTQKTIREYFTTIAQNPEGCKLLRIMLAKHIANNIPGIICIPHNSNYFFLSHTVQDNENFAPHCLFVPLNYLPTQTYMIQKDAHNGLELCIQPMHADCLLFHEMVHHYNFICASQIIFQALINGAPITQKLIEQIRKNSGITRHLSHTAIQSRSSQVPAAANIPVAHHGSIPIDNQMKIKLWICTLDNDEEFLTMYGIRSAQGASANLTLLNESTYMSSKYGFIRATHKDLLSEPNNERQLFINFIRLCGDKELYRYYLYPNQFTSHPVFGMGQYKCSDLNPENGEALIAAQAQDENIEQ